MIIHYHHIVSLKHNHGGSDEPTDARKEDHFLPKREK